MLNGFWPSYDYPGCDRTRDIVIPSPRRPRLSRSGQTHNIFTILQSELALPSTGTGSWLPSRLRLSEFHLTLKRAHFSSSKYAKKKRDILSEKRESGMALKKREFTPESGTVERREN